MTWTHSFTWRSRSWNTLSDAPGAPLKQALIDAGIGQDILGGYQNGILQPYFSVIAKNADKEQKGSSSP